MAIKLPDDVREQTLRDIRQHLAEEHQFEIGNLGAGFLLDLVLEQAGPAIYNRAIADVQVWLQARLEDLDSDLFRAAPRR